MTGLEVEEVNVHVQGVDTQSATEKNKEENKNNKKITKIIKYK